MPKSIKRQALENLRKHILDFKPLAKFYYIEREEDTVCYCAVGHLMKDCGIDLEEIESDKDINGCTIGEEFVRPYTTKLLDKGFTINELKNLQNMNDEQDLEGLIKYIDIILT